MLNWLRSFVCGDLRQDRDLIASTQAWPGLTQTSEAAAISSSRERRRRT
jgi:hypothetical protein